MIYWVINLFPASCYETWSDQWPKDIYSFCFTFKAQWPAWVFPRQLPSNAFQNKKWWILLLKKEPKNTKDLFELALLIGKPGASQTITKRLTIPATRLMRNTMLSHTHTHTKTEQAISKMPFSDGLEDAMWNANYCRVRARKDFTSELDKTSDVWHLIQYNKRKKYTMKFDQFITENLRRDFSIHSLFLSHDVKF